MEIMTSFTQIMRWLEGSGLGETMRSAPYLYPAVESIHILGIAVMAGAAFIVDLRLLGIGSNALPVTTVTRYLLPVSHVGFAIVFLTAIAMFTAIALSVTSSPAAPWKFGLIGIAGLNILVFHYGVYRTVATWDIHTNTPPMAKGAAVISAASWTGVVFAGRFLAY
jgi:hypothetical protein